MPFIGLEEEEESNQQGAPNISGESATFNNQPPGASQAPKPQEQSRSGQYANIQQYIGANQDQAQQMGNKVVGNVEQSAQKATQGIQDIKQQVQKPTQLDPTQYLENPTSIEASDYQKLKQTGGYEGPRGLNEIKNFDNLSRDAQRATEKVGAVGSEAGLDGLLQQNYQRPDYNRGMLSLDNTLVRSNQDNVGRINELQNKYSNLSGMFNETATNVGNNINQAVQQAQANREKFAPAEQQAWERLLNPIQERAQQYNQNLDSVIGGASNELKDARLTQATADRLGITPEQLGNIYNMNLDRYLVQDRTQAGMNNIAQEEERARYAALAQLVGDTSRQEIGNEAQELNPVQFDMDRFNQDRNAVKQQMDNLKTQYANEVIPSLKENFRVWSNSMANYHGIDIPWQFDYIMNITPQTPQQDIKNVLNSLTQIKEVTGYEGLANMAKQLDDWNASYNNFQPNRTVRRG